MKHLISVRGKLFKAVASTEQLLTGVVQKSCAENFRIIPGKTSAKGKNTVHHIFFPGNYLKISRTAISQNSSARMHSRDPILPCSNQIKNTYDRFSKWNLNVLICSNHLQYTLLKYWLNFS